MDTKWNNLINRASDLLLKKKKLLYGIAFVIAGLISYYNYYSVRYMWLSMRLIMHIVVMSLLFGIGISTIFKYIFSKYTRLSKKPSYQKCNLISTKYIKICKAL